MKRPLEPVSEDDDSDIEVEVQRGGCDSEVLKHASWPGAEKRAPEGAVVEQLEPVEGHQLALSECHRACAVAQLPMIAGKIGKTLVAGVGKASISRVLGVGLYAALGPRRGAKQQRGPPIVSEDEDQFPLVPDDLVVFAATMRVGMAITFNAPGDKARCPSCVMGKDREWVCVGHYHAAKAKVLKSIANAEDFDTIMRRFPVKRDRIALLKRAAEAIFAASPQRTCAAVISSGVAFRAPILLAGTGCVLEAVDDSTRAPVSADATPDAAASSARESVADGPPPPAAEPYTQGIEPHAWLLYGLPALPHPPPGFRWAPPPGGGFSAPAWLTSPPPGPGGGFILRRGGAGPRDDGDDGDGDDDRGDERRPAAAAAAAGRGRGPLRPASRPRAGAVLVALVRRRLRGRAPVRRRRRGLLLRRARTSHCASRFTANGIWADWRGIYFAPGGLIARYFRQARVYELGAVAGRTTVEIFARLTYARIRDLEGDCDQLLDPTLATVPVVKSIKELDDGEVIIHFFSSSAATFARKRYDPHYTGVTILYIRSDDASGARKAERLLRDCVDPRPLYGDVPRTGHALADAVAAGEETPRETASIALRDAIRKAAPYGSVLRDALLRCKMLEDEVLVDQPRSLCDDGGLLTQEGADE
ncbi:DNA-binding transcription factor [Aureococcus anophagefferens]|nr:DNA-binding transcription factor [Aureococcus anophagefferens]